MLKHIVATIVTLCAAVCAQAQNGGHIYMGSIDGLVEGKIDIDGAPVTFHLTYENYDQNNGATAISNAFRLSATGGVTWTNVDYGDEFLWGPASSHFDLIWDESVLSWDGSGADTLDFFGSMILGAGLPAGYVGPAVYFTVDIDNDVSFDGETFCIDSARDSPSGFWLWTYGGITASFPPDWDGPYCYDLASNGGHVYMGSVDGLVEGKIDINGDPVTFHIAYENYDQSNNATGIANGFKLSTTGGATWTNVDYGNEFLWGSASVNFDLFWEETISSWDGFGADTLGFLGSVILGAGVPAEYVGPAVYITVDIDDDISFDGEVFCIDSAYIPASGIWSWSYGGSLGSFRPSWDGPYCYDLFFSTCCAIRGDIDNSGVLPIDIADMVYLADYMFNDGPEPPCWTQGDVDGSGVAPLDIADLVYLTDFMFCEGPEPPPCP